MKFLDNIGEKNEKSVDIKIFCTLSLVCAPIHIKEM